MFVRNSMQLATDVYDRAATVMGYPPEHGIAYVHEPFYQICMEKNIRTLYSGYGGDEVVTNKARLFARELYLNGQFGALFRELRGNIFTRALRLAFMVARNGKQHVRQGSSSQIAAFPKLLLKDDVIQDYGLLDYSKQHNQAIEQATSLNDGILGLSLIHI